MTTRSSTPPTLFLWHWRARLWFRLLARRRQRWARLLALPRRVYRTHRGSMAGTVLALSLASTPLVPGTFADSDAPRATIVVTTNAVAPANDAECGVVEAVVAANTDSAYYGCPAGSEADTIVLSGNSYTFTGPFGTNSALPDITTSTTI